MNKKRSRIPLFTAVMMSAVATVAFVTDVPVQAQSNPFIDVKPGSAHYDAIVSLSASGIITGVTATTFEPNTKVTRGEAALVLVNALGWSSDTIVDPSFSDVPKTSPYYEAIAILRENGVIGGYVDGTFKPNNSLTRAQMAKIITKGFQLETATMMSTKFIDVNVLQDLNTKRSIQTLVNYGITTGTTATTFSPNVNLTRGQLATFIFRTMQVVQNDLQIISVE